MIRKEAGLESSSRSYHKRIAKKTSVQFIGAVCAFELGYILLNLFFLIIMDYIGSHSAFQVETKPGQVVVEKFLETW